MTAGVRAGDEAAFDALYDTYVDRLHRYLWVLARGDEERIREALQDCMLRVLRYVKPVRDERILWSWLRKVARSALIDAARRHARRAGREGPLPHAELVPDGAEPDADATLLSALRTAVAHLAEDDRALLAAYYEDGRSQEDLAREHATTRKAIESRLARLRRKLKKGIQAEVGDGDA